MGRVGRGCPGSFRRIQGTPEHSTELSVQQPHTTRPILTFSTLTNPQIPFPTRILSAMELPSTKEFQWKSLAPLPSRRVYSTLVEAAGQVFAVGGCDDNGVPVDSFEVYSPEADQWAALPPMPTARAGVAVAVLGKRIMVIGGVGGNQQPLKVVEMYNTDEGRWRKRSSLREAAMGISVTAKGKEGAGSTSVGLGVWIWGELAGFDELDEVSLCN